MDAIAADSTTRPAEPGLGASWLDVWIPSIGLGRWLHVPMVILALFRAELALPAVLLLASHACTQVVRVVLLSMCRADALSVARVQGGVLAVSSTQVAAAQSQDGRIHEDMNLRARPQRLRFSIDETEGYSGEFDDPPPRGNPKSSNSNREYARSPAIGTV